MRLPSVRTRRFVSLAAAPVAVLLAGAMVWQGSNAAFTAQTYNAGNNWNTGSVSLGNDGTAAAMFAEPLVTPTGQHSAGSHCIVVTATSTVAGVIKMYVLNPTLGGLENNIKITIEQGTGGTFADCTGFTPETPPDVEDAQPLATLFHDHTNFTNGLLPWVKGTGVESMTYKFDWAFDTTGLSVAQVNALQGKDVRTDFQWELQNS